MQSTSRNLVGDRDQYPRKAKLGPWARNFQYFQDEVISAPLKPRSFFTRLVHNSNLGARTSNFKLQSMSSFVDLKLGDHTLATASMMFTIQDVRERSA